MTNQQNNYIETFTGRKFYPLNPRPQDVCIEDIAHALSLLCRYNGHCLIFYSVAQHSLNCARLASTPRMGLLCLLHDAAEAYLSDVSRPIKPHLGGYREIEEKVQASIWAGLGIAPPTAAERDQMRAVDKAMLVAEAFSVMHSQGKAWPDLDGVNPALLAEAEKVPVYATDMFAVERRFLKEYKGLLGCGKMGEVRKSHEGNEV